MAIYLDTNVICRWRSFGEIDRLALSIVSDQIGQSIVIPELVVVEATAYYRRELDEVQADFEKASADLVRAFHLEYVDTEPDPSPERRVREWRERLEEMCEVLPTHAPDAVTALEREVHRRAPAQERAKKPGGARDAAIWLGILRDHHERGETGYFITKNTNDFLDGDELKSPLLEDLAGKPHPLHVRAGIDGMLEGLGTIATDIEVDSRSTAGEAFAAIQEGLADSPIVPRAVFAPLEGHRFQTEVRTGEMIEVLKAQRFARRDDSILIIDAEWELVAECLFQSVSTDNPQMWGSVGAVELSGRLQVYLPETAGAAAAQLIAGQLTTSKEVTFWEDGTLMIAG